MFLALIVTVLLATICAGTLVSRQQALAGRMKRWLPVLVAVSVPIVAVTYITAVPSDFGATGAERFIQVVGGALVFCCVAVGVLMLVTNLAGVDPDASAIARRLAIDNTTERLVSRWVHRVRWRRWVGGVAGVIVALLSGNGGAIPLAGIAGAAIGSLTAELHLCSPRRRSTRVANLEQRRIADYVERSSVAGLGGVAIIAIGTLAWAIRSGPDPIAISWALGAIGAVGLAALMTWRVVGRRRPALEAELVAADDLLRRLAVTNGIAHPMISVGLALLCASFVSSGLSLLALGCGLGATAVWWKNRRGGLDYVLKGPAKQAHLITPVS